MSGPSRPNRPSIPPGSACPVCGSMLHAEDWHYEGADESYEEFTPTPGLRPSAKTTAPRTAPKSTSATPAKTPPGAKSAPTKSAAKPAAPPPAARVMPTRAGVKPAPQPRSAKLKNFAWHDKFVYTEKGTLKATAGNVQLILNYDPMWRDVLAYDEFADCIVTTKKPPWAKFAHLVVAGGVQMGDWTDHDTLLLAAWLGMEYQLSVTSSVAFEGATAASKTRAIHPVRDWIVGLKTSLMGAAWLKVNGKKMAARKHAKNPTPTALDTWLVRICGCEDTPYIRAVGAKFLIGLVARVMKPGCKLDTLPVFEGPQGVLKSTMLRLLCTGHRDADPEDWFLDTQVELGTKDSYQILRRKWLVELAELASMRRTDHLHMKQYVSQQIDTYRPSYGRQTISKRRQCGFAATTNDEKYLKDDTGARRFWPVPVGVIDLNQLTKERDLLWIEALARYEAGESWWLDTPELVEAHGEMVEARRAADPFEGQIAQWLATLPLDQQYTGVSTRQVIERWQPIDAISQKPRAVDWGKTNRQDEVRAGGLLTNAGWRYKRRVTLTGNARGWRYSLYPRESVDILADGSIIERGTGRVIRGTVSGSNLRPMRDNMDLDDPTVKAPGAKKTPVGGKRPAPVTAAKTTNTTKMVKGPAGAKRAAGDKTKDSAGGTAGGRSRSGTGMVGIPSAGNPTMITAGLMNGRAQQDRESHKRDLLAALATLNDNEGTLLAIAGALPENHPLAGRRPAVESILTLLRSDGLVTASLVGKFRVYKLK